MPVSGNEETGVKCVARRSSLEISGVPIKKRRFFRPPSPPPEEQLGEEKPLIPSANVSPRNENGKPLEDSSNVSGVECSFEANNDFLSEENEESSGNVVQIKGNDCTRIKIEEPSSGLGCDSLAKLGKYDEKLQTAVKSSDINASLASKNISAPNAGKEIKVSQSGDEKVTPDIPMVSENAALWLGPKENNVSASEAHSSGGSSQNIASVSLNLSLSMGELDNKGKSDDLQSNLGSCSEQANRSNWDLNTTMDAWEGTRSDVAADQITADALNTVNDQVNVKPLLVNAGSTGGKQPLEGGPRSGFARTFSEPRFNDGNSLNLGLSPSFLSLNSSEGPSGSVTSKNFSSMIPNNMPTGKFVAGNVMVVNPRTVKSEPLDVSLRHDFGKSLVNSMPLPKAIKVELVEKCYQEGQLLSSSCAPKLDSISIKAEPFHGGNQQTLKTVEEVSVQSYKPVLQVQGTEGNSTCPSEKQVLHAQGTMNEFPCSKDQLENIAMKYTCSKDKLSVNGNELKHTEDAKPAEGRDPIMEVAKDSETTGQVALPVDCQVLVHHSDESSIPAMTDTANCENKNEDNSECPRKLPVNEVLDSHGIGEGPVSDEEKINLSGDVLEEDGCGYECESDGNSMPMDIEEDNKLQDHEDGEVQEQQLGSAVGVNPEKGADTSGFDSLNENRKFPQLLSDENRSAPIFEEENTREDPVETDKDSVKEFNDTGLYEKTVEDAGEHISMQESLVVEIRNGGAKENEESKNVEGQPVHNLGNLDAAKGQGTEQASGHAIAGGQHFVETSSPGSVGNMIRNDEGMSDSALPKAETSLNVDDASKDANSGGNRSRIINLSRASNSSSPSKPLSSRSGRERLPDMLLERDQMHSRGRDEFHDDVTWKFSRERYQDQAYRSSRFNFGRGRGRGCNRIVSFRGDRNPERDYNSDFRNSFSEYGIPRNKYVLAEAEAEFGNLNVGPDGAFGAARPGRKMMDGDSSVFRHQPSRKRSPEWRGGPAGRGLQMVRRAARNIGEEGSEGVGIRHGEKFMRGFSDDGQDHTFTRSQTSYKGLDNQYVQGSRMLPSAHRRPHSYIRSKSPIRSRSPGPWSSSKRRSPDVFGGHLELPHRRSPIYRERMRSPDHSVFPGEMLVRRHGSPQYLTRANDLSDMDLRRDPGYLRSAISNRSPNGRVFLRNPRRYGVVDPRERTDGDDFFGGPVHSGRYSELGDENDEDRRRITDRRVPMRSFRPPFSSTDGENFHLNAEDRPRPFRFHLNTEEPQFREPGSLRDREFDRRNKDRPGNVPRRPRGIEG